jgi:surface antigen-like variable number repeat protein
MTAAALLALALQTCPAAPGTATAPADASYEALLSQGLADARDGRGDMAIVAFDRAIALCPMRPEAWVERGGLRFLEARYAEAARDLERALALREDPYVRHLLASSLHLAGRRDEALARWNAVGEPRLRSVTIEGLRHTRDAVARREIALEPEQMITQAGLHAARRRLREVGVFERVSMSAAPTGEGTADVQVALSERHGLASSPLAFGLVFGAHLLQQRARARYDNLDGTGVTIAAEHRWERNRPQTSLALTWPRPLGLPAYFHVQGWGGRQAYALGEATRTQRSRGAELALRRVVGSRVVGQMGLRLARLSSEWGGEGAWDGRQFSFELGLDGWLIDTSRHRLEAEGRVARSAAFHRFTLAARYAVQLAASDEGASVFAVQWHAAQVGRAAPLADRFAPGASPEMDLPLRGRPLFHDGVVDGALLGRSLLLSNVEWHRRLVRVSVLQAGFVVFYDGARVAGTLEGNTRGFHDVGAGLRAGPRGGPLLRLDYGRGLTDGQHALSFGVDHVF